MADKSPGSKLKELIAKSLLSFNFSAYVFSNVRRVADSTIPSIMGVGIMPDGELILMYHPELVDKTDESNLLYIIEHELLHLLNKHPLRGLRLLVSELNPFRLAIKQRVLNIASDCAVNAQGKLPKKVIIAGNEWKLHFAKNHGLPENLTSEDMYYRLMEKEEEKEKKRKESRKKSGEGEKSLVFIPGVGVGEIDPSNLEAGVSIIGSGNGGEEVNIDYHGAWSSSAKNSSDVGTLSRKCDASITKIVRESLKQFQKRRGTLPAGYLELIEKALAPPQAPYYQIISRYVRASKLSKFTRAYSKINRKRMYVFQESNVPIISPFPGKKRDFSFKIAVLLDTSGSMSPDEMIEGLSGTKHIIEKDKHTETTILEVDTVVEREYKCKKVSDIKLSVKGRGGTTLGPGFFRAKELKVDVLLVFTDAMTERINEYRRKDLPKKMIFVVPEKARIDTIKGLGPIVRIK